MSWLRKPVGCTALFAIASSFVVGGASVASAKLSPLDRGPALRCPSPIPGGRHLLNTGDLDLPVWGFALVALLSAAAGALAVTVRGRRSGSRDDGSDDDCRCQLIDSGVLPEMADRSTWDGDASILASRPDVISSR